MNELNTITRANVKTAVACFDTATRKEIDKAIALWNDFATAHGEEATRLAKQRSIALWHIAKDEQAVEKAGYKNFKDCAADIIGLAPSLATQYRKAAERFYCNPDCSSPVKDWYGPAALYELCRVKASDVAIVKAVKSGELKESTTAKEVRAWADAYKALTDGGEKPEVVKMYSAHIDAPNGEILPFEGTLEELHTAMRGTINTDATIENDRFGAFNPHATEIRGKREVAGKGLFLCFGSQVCTAVYFPLERTKQFPDAATVAAQNETIAALMAEIAALKAQAAQND